MKKILKEQKGFALVVTILGLTMISILGLAIIGVTTSNFKMVKIDSRSQSAYYIAESGVNYIIDEINTEVENYSTISNTSEEFFQNIENRFTINAKTLDDFEENSGMQPKAFVTVSHVGMDNDTRDYKIESMGKIGGVTRTVYSIISIGWNKEDNYLSDLLLNTDKFTFNGTAFNAPGKTIVISGQDGTSLNGGSVINVKYIYFKDLKDGVISGKNFGDENDPGDIYLDGNAKILSSGRKMNGNVHTNGDFIVTGGVDIYGDLYVGGRFEVTGGSNIYGDVYVKDAFQIKGGAIIHGNVYAFKGIEANGGGKIKGNLNVVGNSKLVNITIEGLSNVNGNLELDWTPTFKQNVNYTGKLTTPNYFNQEVMNKCKKVTNVPALDNHDYGFSIPNCTVSLKLDSWFVDNGYTIKDNESGIIPHNAKMFVNNYNNGDWQKVTGDIVIVSKGNIILRGDENFTGALIAPNGRVEYSGGGNFDGIVISNNEINLKGGGTTFNLKTIEELFGSQIPITTTCAYNEGNGNKESVKVAIKSGIKEK